MEDLQARYDAQRTYLRGGPLQEYFIKIESLHLVTQNTLEPLLKKYFNPRAQALYFSLCKTFGMDEQDHIPGSIVFIIAQTFQYGMSSIFYFATSLAEEIHNGLIGIEKAKVDKPFCWYSMLMYICLYKGVTFFSKEMKLELERDGEKLHVQLWSADMTWEVIDVSFVKFDKYFASRLIMLLVGDNPRIPRPLLELIRPKDHAKGLMVSYNWGDIIPYAVSTIFRVYGFLGKPHVLPYQVPLKIGIVELL